ncbi:MAG: 2-oxoglutarate oxidoreductase [Anaerolineales bacterium]|nr:MAG: 2-oxoglutarate oxidoreductase [Anaerolineales bacterium]
MDVNNATQIVYQRPSLLNSQVVHYCPGCTHGTAHKLIAEVLGEMNIGSNVIGVASVGCSVFAFNYFNHDYVEAAHGRAPAMATGIKRVLPERLIYTYQGDGDLASIGMGEIMHAAVRGEKITVIFINNAIYGMTGGQLAPTTLPGMVTNSSPNGRDVETTGYPVRMAETLATMDGAGYVVRRSLHDSLNIRKAKKAIRLAFENQKRELGFSMVELLSTCPTNWGLTPQESSRFIEERMLPFYPIGDYKVNSEISKVKG